MKRILVILLFHAILTVQGFAAFQDHLLQTTTAALTVQSLQLGDKAQQLFNIKDGLLKILEIKEGTITSQEDMMIDAATEMKYIATVAYFEGNLLGAVLALKKEFKLHFIHNRIPELESAIKGTISSLQPIQVASSRIANRSAKGQLDTSIKTI